MSYSSCREVEKNKSRVCLASRIWLVISGDISMVVMEAIQSQADPQGRVSLGINGKAVSKQQAIT